MIPVENNPEGDYQSFGEILLLNFDTKFDP